VIGIGLARLPPQLRLEGLVARRETRAPLHEGHVAHRRAGQTPHQRRRAVGIERVRVTSQHFLEKARQVIEQADRGKCLGVDAPVAAGSARGGRRVIVGAFIELPAQKDDGPLQGGQCTAHPLPLGEVGLGQDGAGALVAADRGQVDIRQLLQFSQRPTADRELRIEERSPGVSRDAQRVGDAQPRGIRPLEQCPGQVVARRTAAVEAVVAVDHRGDGVRARQAAHHADARRGEGADVAVR
jgi:hypothetical protein